MTRLRNKNSAKFRRLAQDFKIPRNHGQNNKQWLRDYKNEVTFFKNFIALLIAGGATHSICGKFLTSKTGAFYKKVVLFENKKDKDSDDKICENPVWGKYGTTPSSAAKDIRRYVKEREKIIFKISTKDFTIKHTPYPVTSLFCEQDVHQEKGEYIGHAYSVIMKRSMSKDGHRNGYQVVQKDSINQGKLYNYVKRFSQKINSNEIKLLGADVYNTEIAEKAECLQQAYYDCARAMDGAF